MNYILKPDGCIVDECLILDPGNPFSFSDVSFEFIASACLNVSVCLNGAGRFRIGEKFSPTEPSSSLISPSLRI